MPTQIICVGNFTTTNKMKQKHIFIYAITLFTIAILAAIIVTLLPTLNTILNDGSGYVPQ